MRCFVHSALLAVLLTGCIDTSLQPVELELEVAGTVPSEITSRDGDAITLDRADLAFGPLVFCAGVQAGDFCESARLEWLGSVVVDALDPEVRPAGTLVGTTGPIRSYMYDLGLASDLTAQDPVILDAAEALGGASLLAEFTVAIDGVDVPFEMRVLVQQTTDTELGVPVVRSAPASGFSHELAPMDSVLTMRFDVAGSLVNGRFRDFVGGEGCDTGLETACRDHVFETCDALGGVTESVDCRATDQVCARELGCVDRIALDPTSQPATAARTSLLAGARPAFDWR